jgi:hypothetical protein
MTGDSSEGVFLGQAITNLRLGSFETVEAEAVYRIRYQFVPAKHGPYASEQGAGDSDNLAGALVYFRPKATRLSLLRSARLSTAHSVEYVDAVGGLHRARASIVELWNVQSQDTVGIYFCRDALPDNRRQEVFVVGPVAHDTVVTIFERPLKHGHKPDLVLDYIDTQGTAWYHGELTGDTWKECTAPFSVPQARALLARAGFSHPVVDAAMQGIYDAKLEFAEQANEYRLDLEVSPIREGTAPGCLRLAWHPIGWGSTSNPGKNVSAFDPKSDIPTRVHPFAYAAVIHAAVKCDVTGLMLTSSWRPMLGSCGHRHGTCLDVGALTDKDGQVHLFKWEDAKLTEGERAICFDAQQSDAEEAGLRAQEKKMSHALARLKFKQQKAQTRKQRADQALADADATFTNADAVLDGLVNSEQGSTANRNPKLALALAQKASNRAKKKLQASAQAAQAAEREFSSATSNVKEAEVELESIRTAHERSQRKKQDTDAAWNAVIAANQPEVISKFREELLKSPLVSQIFDPWAMDANTHDEIAATANKRKSSLETLHLTHLHVTCSDPDIAKF